MSIYPVRAKKWWVCHRKWDKETRKDFAMERGLIKHALKNKILKCLTCGKIVTDWNTCYISHAYAYGFNDAYCDDKCLKNRGKKLSTPSATATMGKGG